MRLVLRADRCCVIAGVALLLFGCAARDPYVNSVTPLNAGEWTAEKHLDRTTGTPISNSMLVTRNVSYGAIVFPPPARLQLICFKERPAVIVGFDFKIGSTRNAEVAYRFDDKPGHQPHARIVDDHKSVLIEDPKEVSLFISELAAANNLYLRVRALTAPRTSAEFKVAGAPAAIASAYASCPLNAATAANAKASPAEPDDDD